MDKIISNHFLRTMVESSGDAFFVVDALSQKFIYVNKAMTTNLGYEESQFYSMRLQDIRVSSEDAITWEEEVSQLKKESIESFSGEHLKLAGSYLSIEASLRYFEESNHSYVIGSVRDMTKHNSLLNKIKKQSYQLQQEQQIINQYVPICKTDFQGVITYVNSAFCSLSGFTFEELVGNNHFMVRDSSFSSSHYEELWNDILQDKTHIAELRNIKKDKTTYWVSLTIHPDINMDGKQDGYIAIYKEITNRKLAESIAKKDSLTGVYNRYKFETIMDNRVDEAKRYKKSFSIMILDIDYFKKVNDTYGHLIGDSVLKEFATRIKASLRTSDFLARWGGEEFIVLVPFAGIDEAKSVAQKCKKIVESEAFKIVGTITCSIGISSFSDADDADTMFRRADEALYQAKNSGRNCIKYMRKDNGVVN